MRIAVAGNGLAGTMTAKFLRAGDRSLEINVFASIAAVLEKRDVSAVKLDLLADDFGKL